MGEILHTTDIIDLCPSMPHMEILASLHNLLETRDKKQISNDTLAELMEVVLETKTKT